MKALLLNPPGRRMYLRDYFCSKVSQADYVHPPIDLVVQSGWLAGRFDVTLCDAIVNRLTPDATIERIRDARPDAILSLTGAVSVDEDGPFLARVRSVVDGPIVAMGDVLLERPAEWLDRWQAVDAVATDFSGDSIARYLAGERGELSGIAWRDGTGLVDHTFTAHAAGEYTIPVPRHELFLAERYRYGLSRGRRLASVLTDYGCPFRCSFCVMPSLGWRSRGVANVLEELDELQRLGARELFFLDQTFGLPRRRALDLLEAMARRDYAFGWVAFVRADASDDDLLAAMRRAGCHTVIFGVESGDDAALAEMDKDLSTDELREAFPRARRAGRRAAATILLGLPEDTAPRFDRTMRLVRDLDPDFLSVNVAVPRNGTPLRAAALAEGLASADARMDQSGSSISIKPRALERSDVAAMRDRAVREFYVRPGYLLRRAAGVRSLDELALLASNAFRLLRPYQS